MGRGTQVNELEERFRRGEITNAVVAETPAAWFAGLRPEDMWRAVEAGPWIEGLDEFMERLRAAGTRILLATVTWRFVAEEVSRRYGFDGWCGTEMAATGGLLSGTVSRFFDEFDKLAFVEQWCAARGHGLDGVAAIGDSRSDIPLFERVGLAIAINATADARSAADVSLDTDDLRDVLPLLGFGHAGSPSLHCRNTTDNR